MDTSGCYYCVQVCSYQVWQGKTTGGGWGVEKEGVLADDGKDMEKSFSSPIRLRE